MAPTVPAPVPQARPRLLDGLQMLAALFHRLPDLLRHIGELPGRLPEGLTGHDHDRDRGARDHRRVAAKVRYEPHLAEEVAGAELGEQLVAAPHLGRAGLDREELVRELALPHDVAA